MLVLIGARGCRPGCQLEYSFCPGRKWRFDFAWPVERVALEIEGGSWTGGRHVRGRGFESDCEKYNEAAVQGWRILRVTGGMVQDGRAVWYLKRLLEEVREDGLERKL